MKSKKQKEIKIDWFGFFNDLQLILLTMIFINSCNVLKDGFSWSGLGALICGLLLVGILLHAKNMRFENNEK